MYHVFNRLNDQLCERRIQMGYKIKEAREALNMTQEELALKSGVSRGTIIALEKGTDRVTTSKTLLKIARALGTTVDQIFFEKAV